MLNNSRLQSEVYNLQRQNAVLQLQVSNLNSQISSLRNHMEQLIGQLTTRDNHVAAIRSQLTALQDKLKDKEENLEKVRKLLINLQTVVDDKNNELEKKERKIRELKELLGKSKEEIIDYRLRGKEGRLEVLVQKLGIERTKIRDLCKFYQKKFTIVCVDNNQDEIDDLEDKIETIKDELIDGGIDMVKAQKLCQKCEKIAKLKVEQDKLYQERFEAGQEELQGEVGKEVVRKRQEEKYGDLEEEIRRQEIKAKKEKGEVERLTYYEHGYSSFGFQDDSSSLSIKKKEVLEKFYRNREKEAEDYRREKSLRQNRPTREEKIWSLEEKLEILDNNLQADESELIFLEWRLGWNNALREEVNEKKTQRQQSIRKLRVQKEMREQRVTELRTQVEVPPKK